jgi:hypothetical protein
MTKKEERARHKPLCKRFTYWQSRQRYTDRVRCTCGAIPERDYMDTRQAIAAGCHRDPVLMPNNRLSS